MTPLLSVRDLSITVSTPEGELPIVSDMTFDLAEGETLGIVGESGSGKSLLALALIGLLAPGARAFGSIRFRGEELVGLDDAAFCGLRGRKIAMIFQEPMTALNPTMRIGDQIGEMLRLKGSGRREAREAALSLLDRVRLAHARQRIDAYPHELSGGQRQRVLIAIALAGGPDLLIADEPTTALDVTLEAEILTLLSELVREERMALIMVSHDLGVIARATARTMVMYAGARLEEGPTAMVLGRPLNPYTEALLAASPASLPEGKRLERPRQRLAVIPGAVPAFSTLPPGCRFAGRCSRHQPDCDAGEPPWRDFPDGRGVRCIHTRANEAPA
ncbi:ABC transporter ATP-binding protein [Consotaella salsifontis]|uniref:Peptide/nickel transport system ATP-binding protein n=1 Tax=Consotaella salsifontis TaxID=1365950 RepID=A0A1T4MMX1_9HYPH|nr:ABC transporter ATP-binding protein [Consotaella salsifontis]SJZ68058.1 peptide/nickel transport system ATP-binding protein [Consotaella salsifontis]